MPDAIIKCPSCNKAVAWLISNPHRPFCSERCQLIDLGEWADENRSIPVDPDHDDITAIDLDRD